LTEAGMSTREIAPVLDVSHMTVSRDREAVTPVTPESVDVKINMEPVTPETVKVRAKIKDVTSPSGQKYEVHMITHADQESRREYVARLWNEGYHRDDICEAMEISPSTLTADLAAKGIGGQRPHGTTLERGTLTDKINWQVPFDPEDWRTRAPANDDPRLWCQIHNPRRDKIIAQINERLDILDNYNPLEYNPLESGFQDQLTAIAERCAEINSHYDRAGHRIAPWSDGTEPERVSLGG
jgi:DNA-binding CsgD family transcriptional regulator